MIITAHARESFWLRIKMFFTGEKTVPENIPQKPNHRSHRARAFFELP